MYDVACVGVLCADVLGKPVNRMPDKGKLNVIDQLRLEIGGCAANAAIDLAKIGIKATVLGKIGEDGFGEYISGVLKNMDVGTAGLNVDPSIPTSASIVLIDDEGERSILHCMGSNSRLQYSDINVEIIKESKVLFITGTFLMPGFDGRGAARLIEEAKEAGVICCMDTAWDPTGKWMDKIACSLRHLDWFMPSYDEAVMLCGQTELEDIAEVFMDMGVKHVVIKLGNKGCYVKSGSYKGFSMPTYNDVNVMDTSGAGDSFCAGFITGLVKGWDLEMCAKFANAVGSHCVMEIGTTNGVRSMDEILAFIHTRE